MKLSVLYMQLFMQRDIQVSETVVLEMCIKVQVSVFLLNMQMYVRRDVFLFLFAG